MALMVRMSSPARYLSSRLAGSGQVRAGKDLMAGASETHIRVNQGGLSVNAPCRIPPGS